MTSTMFADTVSVDAEFAALALRIDPASTAKVDPFSEPGYEPLEEDDDQPTEEDDPVIDWP
ncbi:hypothetical protein ACFQZ2_06355 [Streptomonospora algeriensis]|uniref:Uncharacterized protein n=1 Tax=Streptomonospora algeriensis TaxID=995084 RepID=A0ABW3B9N6_9ACTN